MNARSACRGRLALLAAAVGLAGCTQHGASPPPAATARVLPAAPAAVAFTPPPRRAIPDDAFGAVVRQGEALFTRTGQAAPQFVGNALTCQNCHLDAGRLADSAPLWAAWVGYPVYRSKTGHVNTFAERLQGCFRFSMNGKAPPLGDPVLVALESYSYWMATGAPTHVTLAGAGYPILPQPEQTPDRVRGKAVYTAKCSICHGAEGRGREAWGRLAFPPLWGPDSFNWGAGMGNVNLAAGFIKANMPLGNGWSLSDQEAWDVALYVDSQERPQDPRYTGDVAETRARFHATPRSMYGRVVDGHVLGSVAPQAGARPRPPSADRPAAAAFVRRRGRAAPATPQPRTTKEQP
ncbi:MAG: c-type cytochrome [Xanthomonadaceae bacterium]|nr:c-type cytochrome [Xanthomonadaceae bacterium]